MRLHFQERPWDLYLSVGYSVVVSALLLATNTGDVLALLLLLLVPGYVLVATLFPRNKEIDWIERLVLSFGLSVAIVPLLGLMLTFTPFGIRFGSIVVSIAIFTGLLGTAAYLRRTVLPIENRLSATIVIPQANWAEYSRTEKVLTVAVALSILFAFAAFLYVVVAPRPGESFTEFYILGPGGNATGYPTQLNISQLGIVIIGLANHEHATVGYHVRVDLVGVQIVYNASLGYNQTIALNRTTLSQFNASLGDGQNWTQRYAFSIPSVGTWMIEFLLFRDPDLSNPYREARLFVDVL